MDKFRSLLPPSAIHPERAQEQASTELITALDTDMVRKVKNPDTCPAHLLPGWHGNSRWIHGRRLDRGRKRQVIRDAAYVHQHRGTAGAVRRSLSAVSLPTTVIEWWEDTPRKDPYTFRVEVYSLQAVDEALYQRIRRQVDKAKNLRSLLTTIDVIADLGAKGTYYAGGAVTAWIDVVIEAGE